MKTQKTLNPKSSSIKNVPALLVSLPEATKTYKKCKKPTKTLSTKSETSQTNSHFIKLKTFYPAGVTQVKHNTTHQKGNKLRIKEPPFHFKQALNIKKHTISIKLLKKSSNLEF